MNDPRVEVWLAPLPGGNRNLFNDPVWDAIGKPRKKWLAHTRDPERVDQEGNVSGSPAPGSDEWAVAAELAAEALTRSTRDLRLAAFLTEALAWSEGTKGLRAGFDCVKRLLREQWDDLLPPLKEGSAKSRRSVFNALDDPGAGLPALLDRIPVGRGPDGSPLARIDLRAAVRREEEALRPKTNRSEERGERIRKAYESAVKADEIVAAWDRAPFAEQSGVLDDARDALAALLEVRSAAVASFPEVVDDEEDLTTLFRETQKSLEEFLGFLEPIVARKRPAPTIPAIPAAPPAVKTTTAALAPEDSAPRGEPPIPPTPEPGTAEEARAAIAAAARKLRSLDPQDPAPYLVIRALRLGEIDRVDQSAAAPAPDPRTRTLLHQLERAGDHRALSEAAEEALAGPAGRGWIDAHRLALAALNRLDRKGPADAVRRLLVAVARDRPGWVDADLDDHTAAANNATRAWLATLIADSSG